MNVKPICRDGSQRNPSQNHDIITIMQESVTTKLLESNKKSESAFDSTLNPINERPYEKGTFEQKMEP